MKTPQESTIRFAVYPGNIESRNDGDIHFIGFRKLCQLYSINPKECLDMSHRDNHGRDISGLQRLGPSYAGDYNLKKEL